MRRRQFLNAAITTAIAGSASLFRGSHAQAFDLVVRGGRVIDPSLHVDTIADIGIAGGRIAAIGPNLSSATEELDATGRLVIPGLLDIHGHYTRDAEGAHVALSDGITGFVDAGSGGADNIDDIIANARSAPQPVRLLLNIGRRGVTSPGDTADMALADVDAAKAAIARNLDYIVGVKARLTEGVTADDVEVLRRSQEVASYFNLPVMIHMGQSATSMRDLIKLLKPGDIVTHMYAPPPSAIVDDKGKMLPEILEARRRGIWFDVGNGTIDHLRWDTFDQVMAEGFWPDTISTDGFSNSRTRPGVVDFPNVLSKWLNFGGMTLSDVIAAGSLNAARIFPFLRDKGTLNIGAQADIAILELREGEWEFLDNYEGVRAGRQRLFPFETLLAGRRAPRV